MEKFKIYLIYFGVCFLISNTYSQFYGRVDSVQMNPANPTSIDPICLRFFNTFPSSGCYYPERFLTNYGSLIRNKSYYCVGNYYSICHHVDTICIEPLLPGFYTFNYVLKKDDYFSGCDNYATADSVFMQFNVQNPGSVNENSFGENCLTWERIAGEDAITVKIDCNLNNKRISVANLLGMEIFNCGIDQDQAQIRINMNPGIYFVTLFTGQGKLTRKVMVSK